MFTAAQYYILWIYYACFNPYLRLLATYAVGHNLVQMLFRICEDLSPRQIHVTGSAGSQVNACKFGRLAKSPPYRLHHSGLPRQGVSAHFPRAAPITCAARFFNFRCFDR